jgi:hypothetical protein
MKQDSSTFNAAFQNKKKKKCNLLTIIALALASAMLLILFVWYKYVVYPTLSSINTNSSNSNSNSNSNTGNNLRKNRRHRNKFTTTLVSYLVNNSSEYHDQIPGLVYAKDSGDKTSVIEPPMWTLGQLLTDWPPDNVAPTKWINSQAHPSEGNHVRRLDYSDLEERALAQLYREAEYPFIIYNVPELDNGAREGFSYASLMAAFGKVPR